MGLLKKIIEGIKLMHPENLREHNINALLDKQDLTDAEMVWLQDMKAGGAGMSSRAMDDQDYVDAWRNSRR